jgi:hypothetical protein
MANPLFPGTAADGHSVQLPFATDPLLVRSVGAVQGGKSRLLSPRKWRHALVHLL